MSVMTDPNTESSHDVYDSNKVYDSDSAVAKKERSASGGGDDLSAFEDDFNNRDNDASYDPRDKVGKRAPNDAAQQEQAELDNNEDDEDQPDDDLNYTGDEGDGAGRGRKKSLRNRVISKLSNKQKARIAGSVAGVLLGAGITGSILTPMLVPLHWLHYAQGLHILDETDDETSSLSISKLYRYYKTRDFNRTRLSFLQNRNHDKFIAKLADEGIHIQPRANGRATNVIEFDINKLFPEQAGKSYSEVDNFLTKKFGKGLSFTRGADGSVLRVSIKDAGTLTQYRVTRFISKQTGSNLLDTALTRRHLKSYFNIADLFHPERKVDNSLLKFIDKIFPASAKARTASKEGKNAWEKFKESEAASGFAKGAAAVLIAQMGICSIQSVSKKITEIQHEAIVAPGQIYAVQTAAYAAQIEADSSDLNPTGMSTATESMYKNGLSPMDSNAFKKLQGLPASRVYDSATSGVVGQIDNAFSSESPDKLTTGAVDQIRVGDVALCSPAGIAIGAGAGIAILLASIPTTGGVAAFATEAGAKLVVTFAAGYAFGALLGMGEDYAAKSLAGSMPELTNQGVVGGELTVRAAQYNANSGEAGVGGIVASPKTINTLNSDIAQTKADEAAQQSLYARVLDPKNGDSIVGRLINNVSPSPKDNLSNFASLFMSLGKTLASMPATLFTKHAYAATADGLISSYDSISSIEDVDANEEQVAAIYDGVQGQYYRDKVLECTGNTISWNGTDGYWDVTNDHEVNTTLAEYKTNCANSGLLGDNNWTKIRASLRLTSSLEHLYCGMINVEDSCQKSGMGNMAAAYSASTTPATAGSDALGPATLSRAQGKWGGFTNGNIPTSALTNVADITASDGSKVSFDGCKTWMSQPYLNPSAAVSLVELNKAYKAAMGENLKLLSCYRDYDQQVAARKKYGSNAAKPGTSNHGWGLAIDFDNMSSYSGAGYKWLLENGAKYGWVNPKNMQQGGSGPHEPWHWEYARPVSGGSSL